MVVAIISSGENSDLSVDIFPIYQGKNGITKTVIYQGDAAIGHATPPVTLPRTDIAGPFSRSVSYELILDIPDSEKAYVWYMLTAAGISFDTLRLTRRGAE